MSKKYESGSPVELVTMIGADTTLRGGNVHARRDLRIDGTVEADVLVEGKLVVGPEGSVAGAVAAEEMILCGRATGSVIVRNALIVKKTAVVHGVICAGKLSIEEGASGDFTARIGRTVEGESDSLSREFASVDEALTYAGDGLDTSMTHDIEMSIVGTNGSIPSSDPAATTTRERGVGRTPSRSTGTNGRPAGREVAPTDEVPPSDGEISYETGRFW